MLEDNLTEEEALEKEIYYIALHNTYLSDEHYNMTPGGEGYSLSDESRRRFPKQIKVRKERLSKMLN